MDIGAKPNTCTHHGRNIKRLREMLGVKQDAVAFELEITQQSFSEMEQKEIIDERVLDRVAKILNVPIDAIKNMNDEATINYINTFNEKVDNSAFGSANTINCSFNPIDKVVELYERMLKEKDDKIAMLEQQRNSGRK